MNITEFILARLDEDEETASYIDGEAPLPDVLSDLPAVSSCMDAEWCTPTGWVDVLPARILADIAFKRAIVEHNKGRRTINPDAPDYSFGSEGLASEDCPTNAEFLQKWTTPYTPQVLRDLAAIYRDHPDYREEWQ